MKLTLGFSPCPNDCFMFDAIVNRRIDLEGLELVPHLADVESLNAAALAGDLRIAIPGKYTTANFLLGIAFPAARNKFELVFSEIEGALLRDEYDAGLIIHENRFTYEDKGLRKIVDLGEFWERETGAPIPLGGIAVSRQLPEE